MYKYCFKSSAVKELERLPKHVQRRIISKIDYYILSKKPLFFADRLIDHRIGQYRFRVGDYRVIFDVEDDRIVILTLDHRKDIYR